MLDKKFIQIFMQHLMEKTKQTFWPTEYKEVNSKEVVTEVCNIYKYIWYKILVCKMLVWDLLRWKIAKCLAYMSHKLMALCPFLTWNKLRSEFIHMGSHPLTWSGLTSSQRSKVTSQNNKIHFKQLCQKIFTMYVKLRFSNQLSKKKYKVKKWKQERKLIPNFMKTSLK